MQILEPLISFRTLFRRTVAPAFIAIFAAFLGSVPAAPAEKPATKTPSVYDYSLVDFDGKVVPLSTYKGKVLLIVNLASQSIYKTQIAALNELQKSYAGRGLMILGIPSADFGGEELKDSAALRKEYSETLHAGFPIFASATQHGVQAIPLYTFLCDPKLGLPGGEIHWNFTKFLIDREGKPLARYEVDVDPADIDFHVLIETALDGKFKKQTGKKSPDGGGGDDDDDDGE